MLNVGSLVMATALLSLLWELRGRRVFAQEVLAAAGVAADVRAAGLRAVNAEYLRVAKWSDLFRDTTSIDLLVSWSATWRSSNEALWKAWIGRSGVMLRVLLPDPDDPSVVAELAKRFDMSNVDVISKIREAAAFYSALQGDAGTASTVTVAYSPFAPVWAYYGFGGTRIVTVYPATPGRTPDVPAMVFTADGSVGAFLGSQFERAWARGRTV